MPLLKNRDRLPIADQVQNIKKTRQLTPQVYDQFVTLLLSNQPINADLRQQIVLLLDEIKLGSIQITATDPKYSKR